MNREELEESIPWSAGAWKSVDCGAGWFELISTLTDTLKEICPEYRVTQIKEKFGGLRYYISGIPYYGEDGEQTDPYRLIAMAEYASVKTCEICGEPGETRPTSWITTLCEGCYEKRKDRSPEVP